MIDYEKKYWSENEFKLNGENYVGYVGIKDRNAYVFDTAEPLTKNSTFYTQFNCGNYFFDRILDESLILPFNKKEVQFYPNDFLNKGTIKSILQKLQANNDFIYKCSTISDTLIPIVSDCLNFTSSSKSPKTMEGYRPAPEATDYNINNIAYRTNPNWDKKSQEKYIIKKDEQEDKYEEPQSEYPATYKTVPIVKNSNFYVGGRLKCPKYSDDYEHDLVWKNNPQAQTKKFEFKYEDDKSPKESYSSDYKLIPQVYYELSFVVENKPNIIIKKYEVDLKDKIVYIDNPNASATANKIYELKDGESPKESYSSVYNKIPKVKKVFLSFVLKDDSKIDKYDESLHNGMVRYITNPNYTITQETPNNNSKPLYSNDGYKIIYDKDGNFEKEDYETTSKADKIPELAFFNGEYYFIVSNRWAKAYTKNITGYINNKIDYYTNPYWDKKEDKTYYVTEGEWVKEPYDYTYIHEIKDKDGKTIGTEERFYKHVPKIYFQPAGVLKPKKLSNSKNNTTSQDSMFYPQIKDGNATYNFDDITASDICVTDVIIDADGDKAVKLLIFLAFKTKLVIIKYTYYPENFNKNLIRDEAINFNSNSTNVLIIKESDPNRINSIEFMGLNDVRVKGNYLYLVDEKLHMVLRYDIEYLRKTDDGTHWNKQNLRLLDILQGEGTIRDDVYFKNPCAIDADDKYIYVADKGNGCIKKYTESFDYVKTIRNSNFSGHDLQTISINPYSFTLSDGTKLPPNTLWVFTSTTNYFYVHVLDDNRVVYSHRIDRIEILDDKYMWDEKFKSVKFSFGDSNYYYLCTTKRVYKIHLSKPTYPFASLSYYKQRMALTTMQWSLLPYPWHTLPAGQSEYEGLDVTWSFRPSASSAEILDNKSFCICGCDSYTEIRNGIREQFNGDIIFHIGNLINQSEVDTYCKENQCEYYDIPKWKLAECINQTGVFLYTEPTSFITTLTNFDFPIYLIEELEDISSSEYVNSETFNKIIYKIAYNLVNLKNHLIGRFWGAYNIDGLMVYDQLEFDDFYQQLRIENIDDLFVHDNEQISIMFNRIFEKIYDIQERLLEHMAAKYRAISSFTNNSFKII